MNLKSFVVLFIVLTLFVSVISIVYAGSSSGSSGGIRTRLERLSDPFSRQKYFGAGYEKPVFGYGKKDASTGMGKGAFGAKGVSARNKLYNSLYLFGRDPARVSHFDSAWKGSKIIDKIIYLNPVISVEKDNKVTAADGFVRLLSQEYEQNARLPYSEVHVTVVNAPPSSANKIAAAWLVDEDTGYVFPLGEFWINLRGTGSLSYKVYQFFGVYDTFVITEEDLNSQSPFPSEDILLVGDLK